MSDSGPTTLDGTFEVLPDVVVSEPGADSQASDTDLDATTSTQESQDVVSELRSIELTRDAAFRQVTSAAPTNDYGLPVFIYRPDLVPQNINQLDDSERMDILIGATIDIIYDEGFPTFIDGTAFWSQMSFEPDDAYTQFKAYLEQGNTQGIRRLEDLFHSDGNEDAALLNGATRAGIKDAFIYYNWVARCKAYDLFKVAAHHKLREKRILGITDQHFLQSETLLTRLNTYFEKKDDEGEYVWLSELNPKVALDFFDKLTRVQRTALGLGSHGIAEDGGLSRNADVSVTLRQIAAGARDPNASGDADNGADLSLLLSDPETAVMAQELIIKVGEAARK